MLIKTCKHCGNEYQVYAYRVDSATFCSKRCFDKNRVTKVECRCDFCGNVFSRSPSVLAITSGKYCSRKCYHKSRAPLIKECEVCGESIRVRRHDGQENRYCSKRCMGLGRRGENGPGWKGGVTPETRIIRSSTEYKEWRNTIFARDNWTCQDCGKSGGRLHAHHVFPFAEFQEHRLNLWNGITLCKLCHANYHPAMAASLGLA